MRWRESREAARFVRCFSVGSRVLQPGTTLVRGRSVGPSWPEQEFVGFWHGPPGSGWRVGESGKWDGRRERKDEGEREKKYISLGLGSGFHKNRIYIL